MPRLLRLRRRLQLVVVAAARCRRHSKRAWRWRQVGGIVAEWAAGARLAELFP